MRMLAAGIVASLVIATPASAQIAGSMRGLSGSPSIRGDILRAPPAVPSVVQRVSVSRDLRDIRGDIQDAREAGQLSRREARALRREGYRIEAESARFGRDGYSDAEIGALQVRSEALRSALVAKRSQAIAGK